jgi:hypothetical protein
VVDESVAGAGSDEVDEVGAVEVLVGSVGVDPEVGDGAGEVLVVEVVVWSAVGAGPDDDEVVDEEDVVEPVGAVEVLVEVVSVAVEVAGGGGVVCVVVVGVVASDTVPVVADTVPLAVEVTVCVVVDVVEPASVPPVVVWPRRADANEGEASAVSNAPRIAIATKVPLPISRLRIPDIPCVGWFDGAPTPIRAQKTGNCLNALGARPTPGAVVPRRAVRRSPAFRVRCALPDLLEP